METVEKKNGVDTRRMTVRISEDDYERLKYWAQRENIKMNDFVQESVHHYIRYLNHDLDLPDATVRRLNQLVDVIQILSSNQASLERTVIRGFESLMGMTRGENYLNDLETGDLE
jgi:predicted DNA-binding protein